MIINTLGPAGALKLRAQLDTNIEAILLTWKYCAWLNVSGVMHNLDETPIVQRSAADLPSFLFPSQVASLMLVETEDMNPVIAPIVWPVFGPNMALRYPTQPPHEQLCSLIFTNYVLFPRAGNYLAGKTNTFWSAHILKTSRKDVSHSDSYHSAVTYQKPCPQQDNSHF